MTRRSFLLGPSAGLLVAGVLLLWPAGGCNRPLIAPRNVLLLTIDTLRADRLGCYGSDKDLTPNLDALAADGVRFSKAFTPVPLTGPAHASMLTGLYPLAHGLRNNGTQVLPSDLLLVPEILRERGFQTAAIVSALVLASNFGLNQGFDLYYEDGITLDKGLWYDQRRGDKTIDRALTWLRAERDRPFFLWVHLFDPHAPYEPPPPFKERYDETPYDGEVAFTDAQVGRLLSEVKALDLYEDTLIIVAGDHGESLGEHGERFHAIFLYNATTRVPMIVRTPGGRRGLVIEDLSSVMDIAPTILEALQIEPPEQMRDMQGVSLLPSVARGERVPARSLYLESIYASASYGWATSRALLQSSAKFIDLPKPEMYDLASDPHEMENAYLTQPARASDMKEEFDRLHAEVEESSIEADTAAIDDETRDRLMSLGYIGGQQSLSSSRIGPDPKDMAFMSIPIGIARNLMQKKEYADAEKVFRKILEVDPDNRIALIQIGQTLAGQERLDEAIPFFEHAITVYPDVEEFHRAYGWTMLNSLRFADAQSVFEKALLQLPESGHLHFLLGYARFLEEDWAGAQEELELAVDLSKQFGKPHYLLAICHLKQGDDAGALSSLEAYLMRDPDVDSIFNDPYLKEMRGLEAFQDLVKRFL